MVLTGITQDNDKIDSRWKLTYEAGWEQILKAVEFVWPCYKGASLIKDGIRLPGMAEDDIKDIQPGDTLMLQGKCGAIGACMSMAFHTGTRYVEITVWKDILEFKETDYMGFNRSVGQYLDAMDIHMNR